MPDDQADRPDPAYYLPAYRQQQWFDDHIMSCGLPKRHRLMLGQCQDGPDGRWRKVKDDLCSNLGNGYLVGLIGPRGVGKTQIAAYVCAAALRRTKRPLYVHAVALFMAIRDCMREGGSELATAEQYCSPHLLVIDQLEERKHSDFEDRMLTYIIDRRYADLKDTLLVSNESAAEFSNTIGESAASRLRQCGKTVRCGWDSFRDGEKPLDASVPSPEANS